MPFQRSASDLTSIASSTPPRPHVCVFLPLDDCPKNHAGLARSPKLGGKAGSTVVSRTFSRCELQEAQLEISQGPVRTSNEASQSRQSPRSRSMCRLGRSEEHTSELQSRRDLVCRLLLEK